MYVQDIETVCQPLLNERPSKPGYNTIVHEDVCHTPTGGSKSGTLRCSYVVLLASLGSCVFAYSISIVGGVLTLRSFERDFRYGDSERTTVNANCVSLLQAGAFFSCFLMWPLTSRAGRKWSIVMVSAVFCIGAIAQVVNSHSLHLFYAGRLVSGVGNGALTVLVPMYTAEIAPKHIRGKLGSMFQLFFAVGAAASYWVNYAVSLKPSATSQWQIAIGSQLIPGLVLGLGMLMVQESPRWLAKQGRLEEAHSALVWFRGGTANEETHAEFREILDGIEFEAQVSHGSSRRELLLPSNQFRIATAVTLQFALQFCGMASLACFAPQLFAAMGAKDKAVFISGCYGITKVIGIVVFILVVVDRVGRRKPFMIGSFVMGSLLLTIGILVSFAQVAPLNDDGNHVNAYGLAAIVLLLTEAFVHSVSWSPLVWVYISEIFPLAIREFGIATAGASQWLASFLVGRLTPFAIAYLGWRLFIVFAVINFSIVLFSYYVIRETAGKSLEEMETVFNTREE